jgi:hypothetical protein
MNPDSQRRLHVRRALLNKKNGANTQSFLCPLIQFAGVAKLHQRRLSDLLRHVICLHGILVIQCPAIKSGGVRNARRFTILHAMWKTNTPFRWSAAIA